MTGNGTAKCWKFFLQNEIPRTCDALWSDVEDANDRGIWVEEIASGSSTLLSISQTRQNNLDSWSALAQINAIARNSSPFMHKLLPPECNWATTQRKVDYLSSFPYPGKALTKYTLRSGRACEFHHEFLAFGFSHFVLPSIYLDVNFGRPQKSSDSVVEKILIVKLVACSEYQEFYGS